MEPARIFAHRGLWDRPEEKNSLKSLQGALVNGFSLETDIRSFGTRTTISHDPTDTPQLFLDDLLYQIDKLKLSINQKIAFNIKSDGLYLDEQIKMTTHKNFFYFDMSVPEKVKYTSYQLPVADRISPFEKIDSIFSEKIYWVDCLSLEQFYFTLDHHKMKKSHAEFIFVSPELHGEDPQKFWEYFKEVFLEYPNFAICTDFVNFVYDFMRSK
jgi:hypothetical protein